MTQIYRQPPTIHSGERTAIAFDVGSHLLRTLRHDGPRLVARSQQTSYTVLPFSETSEQRLAQAGVRFAKCDEGYVVLGAEAAAMCAHFPLPLVAAFEDGDVPRLDAIGRQVLSLLTDSVLPLAADDGVCVFSLRDRDASSQRFFEGAIRLRGYTPVALSAPAAGGLIALATHRMTGVAIDLGASRCEISVLATGREIASRSIAAGGKNLDEFFFDSGSHTVQAGPGASFRDLDRARRSRERVSEVESEILPSPVLRHYRALADEIATSLVDAFEEALGEFPFCRPTPVAVLGGLSRDRHFVQQLRNKIAKRDTASYFDADWISASDDFATCRGLLLAAEIESRMGAFATTPPVAATAVPMEREAMAQRRAA